MSTNIICHSKNERRRHIHEHKKGRTTDRDVLGGLGKKRSGVFLICRQIPCLANKATQASSSKQSKNSPWVHFKVPFSPITSVGSTWNKYKSSSRFCYLL